VTLDNNHYEPTVESLLEYYTNNFLPKKTVKLGKPYKECAVTGYVNIMR